jgi:hypothetical protein
MRRLGVSLWVVGGALAVFAGFLYWRSLFGIEREKEEMAGIERAMAQERRQLEVAEAGLKRMNLRRQNLEATFLNDRIADRTFPWSALFDDLGDVLPREVRLYSLAPAPQQAGRARRDAEPARQLAPGAPRRVYLQMTGAAESDEALIALLQGLFASPYFDSPSLPRETREGNALNFALNVFYLPDAPRVQAAEPEPAAEILEAPPGRGAVEGGG